MAVNGEKSEWICVYYITYLNPLNAELNPICHLLALLGAHHIFHISGLRVKVDKTYSHLKKNQFDAQVIFSVFTQTPLHVSGVSLAHHQGVEASWIVRPRSQKADFFFRRNGQVHLNRQGRQFSRLLAAEVCASAVVMLDKPCSEVVWRVLATHSIRQFPLHFPSRASPCDITFELECKPCR